jgi:hypothetical protein
MSLICEVILKVLPYVGWRTDGCLKARHNERLSRDRRSGLLLCEIAICYLTKPIKVNEFMETLDVALKFAKAHSARGHQKDLEQ